MVLVCRKSYWKMILNYPVEIILCCKPVLVKRKEGERNRHFLYNEPESDTWLKETLLTKMKLAGLEDDTLEVHLTGKIHVQQQN